MKSEAKGREPDKDPAESSRARESWAGRGVDTRERARLVDTHRAKAGRANGASGATKLVAQCAGLRRASRGENSAPLGEDKQQV